MVPLSHHVNNLSAIDQAISLFQKSFSHRKQRNVSAIENNFVIAHLIDCVRCAINDHVRCTTRGSSVDRQVNRSDVNRGRFFRSQV